jgi:lipid-binding SYLF domain-containing protein
MFIRPFSRTHRLVRIAFPILGLALFACAKPEGETASQQRAHIRQMDGEIKSEVFAKYPEARSLVSNSYGYATFTNIETKLSIVGSGNGYGLATNRKSGKQTFMSMRKLHVGFGAGVQEFDLLMVFKSKENFDQFIESGWQFGGGADAAVKRREGEGQQIGIQAPIDPSLDPTVFQLTEAGISVGATAEGFKFSVDDDLN